MIAPGEHAVKGARGLSKIREIYDHLNAPFMRYVSAVDKGEPVDALPPFPRLYIGKNRTLLTDASTDPSGLVAVLMNINVKPRKDCLRRDLLELISNVVLVKPVGPIRTLDSTVMDTHYPSDYLPKAFVKVKILKVYKDVKTIFTDSMEKAYLRRAYATHRLSKSMADLKRSGDPQVASYFMESILTGQNVIPQEQIKAVDKLVVIERKRSSPSTQDTSTDPSTEASITDAHAEKRHRSNVSSDEMVVEENASMPTPSSDKTVASSSTLTNTNTNNTNIHDSVKTDASVKEKENALESSDELGAEAEAPQKKVVPKIKQEASDSGFDYTQYLGPGDEAADHIQDLRTREYYLSKARDLWSKVFDMCQKKNVPVIKASKYKENTSTFPNAEGFFKHVYYVHNDPTVVVQTFKRMTITQRATEVVSLLELHSEPHMGQIVEVLQSDDGEVVGLSMQRYQKTLKQYTHMHSHHRLTAYQKMDLILQMLGCMKNIHGKGIAHRDLSEVNFMVDENSKEKLQDGTFKADLRLIDFGKAIFATPDLMNKWWVEKPKVKGEYEGEVLPETDDELKEWCKNLPWIKAKPDHGYRLYRSIQTLPRSRTDEDVLPYLVHPIAEDLYSIGTIIWKVFAETEPWHGILDTDLRGLRETVKTDHQIDTALRREVSGELSRQLLQFFLRASPTDRKSAAEVLDWMQQPDIHEGLIKEWTEFSPLTRTRRHKTKYAFEEEQSRQQRRKPNVTATGKRRGRPPLNPEDRKSGRQPSGRPRGRPRKILPLLESTPTSTTPTTTTTTTTNPIPTPTPSPPHPIVPTTNPLQ